MEDKYSEAQIEQFYNVPRDWSPGNPYAFTSAYVVTDEETQIAVCVFLNDDNLSSNPDVVASILALGDYDSNREDIKGGRLKLESSYLADADLFEDHCSDTGIDGWEVSLDASGMSPEDAGRCWVDPYQLMLVMTSVPDSESEFHDYHLACWNVMMSELESWRG